MTSDIETPTLTNEERDHLFAAIGRIVVNFQQIELWLAESLASLLLLQDPEDRHIVLSAMSFSQKVDLLAELYSRKKTHRYGVEIRLIRKALYAAEQFRNRIVHSVWAVESSGNWVRVKGSLKSKDGFSLAINQANISKLEAAATALLAIREWELKDAASLESAVAILHEKYSDA